MRTTLTLLITIAAVKAAGDAEQALLRMIQDRQAEARAATEAARAGLEASKQKLADQEAAILELEAAATVVSPPE